MRNPLLPGFHPDPSICRVGEDMYIATSTFEYLPGIPIFRTRDLEDVELIGHVAVRDGQLGVSGVPTDGGVWAPTIRHHAGKFWIVVSDMMGTGRGNLLFTADDPAGPWSDGVVMDVSGIDPDIAWDDDGNCYVTMSGLEIGSDGQSSHVGITQVRLDPETGAALTNPIRLWSGTGGMFPEAPHLYKVGDYWYLMIAEGGTERGHAVTIARGTSPEGPFEAAPHNPLVTARGTDNAVQNTGHGDLIELADGSWAMVLLGTRPRSSTRAFAPMGRESFVVPVTWHDDWPSAQPVLITEQSPAVKIEVNFPSETPGSLDGFDPEVVGVRAFPRDIADLTARPGWARLTGRGAGMEDLHPQFIGLRQQSESAEFVAELDLATGIGGVAVRYDENSHLDVEATRDAVTVTMNTRGLTQSWTHVRENPDRVTRLKIVAWPPNPAAAGVRPTCDHLSAWVEDAGGWVKIAEVDGAFLSSDFTESFTGRIMGVFARDGEVDARSLVYRGQDVQRVIA